MAILVGSVAVQQVFNQTKPKYEVTFSQTPCGADQLYALPWAVQIANTTIQKGGSILPADDSRALASIPASLVHNETTIIFNLADGEYRYILHPAGDFWDPVTFPKGNFSGLVQVNGRAVSVNVIVANPGGGSC